MRYVPSREASRILGVHPQTLRTWAREGRINYIRTEGNQRRYDVDSYLGQSRPAQTVCYCRVSSKKQSADLDRQVAFMRERYPDAEIVSDVGSGLNFRRKGLLAILERLHQGDKLRVVVAYRDRLGRFGTELIETLLERNGGELVVLNQRDLSPERSSRLTFSPSSRSLELASTDCGDTVRKSRKIRLYPDARQRAELRRWFGAARYAYNQTVELLSSEDALKAVKREVRNHILPTLPPWHRSAPREVLVGAIFDACRAVSAAKKHNAELARDKSRGRRQDEGFARVRFRSRKNPRQTFTVQANCVSDMGIYRSKLADMRMAEKLPVPENRNICRLSLRYGQYHLSVPYDEKLPPERENQARVVALDPGVRSFLTWYCADSVGKIGEGAFFRIQRLCERLDDLLSRAAKSPSRKRRNMRRAAGRMRLRIENLVQELHRQAARFLVTSFDVILLPGFETSEMVERSRRRIRSQDRAQLAEPGALQVQALSQEQGCRGWSDSAGRKRGLHVQDCLVDR